MFTNLINAFQVFNSSVDAAKKRSKRVFHARAIDLYFLGIAIVIGGQLFSWNPSLAIGFWETLFAFLFIMLGYLFLILCLSEMTGSLPFSGGVYGFIRATTGPYYGFIVGCCEAMQNICYVSATAIPLANMTAYACGLSSDYEPLFWVLFYVTSLAINIAGNQVFWKFNYAIGLISILLIVIYILGTISYADFSKYVTEEEVVKDHTFDVEGLIKHLPIAAWFFIGVESLPLCGRDCSEPKNDIPMAMLTCLGTLIITGICVLMLVSSQYPGVDNLSDVLLPLNFGYMRMFQISDRGATWLAIPATYATGFGFMFVYGRQMVSMARSGLFPKQFKATTKFSGTPYVALCVGSLLSFILVLISVYWIKTLQSQLFYLCCLASYLVYINAFIGYIIFSTKYSSVARHFRNPLGVPSAVAGIIIFTITFISVIGFQDGDYIPILLFVVVMILLTVYYFGWVSKNQKFSEEEQKALFTAYIINANTNKKSKARFQQARRKQTARGQHQTTQSQAASSSRTQDHRSIHSQSLMDSVHSDGHQTSENDGILDELEEQSNPDGDSVAGRSEISEISQLGGLLSIAQHRILHFSALHRQSSLATPEHSAGHTTTAAEKSNNTSQTFSGHSWSTMTLPTFVTSVTHHTSNNHHKVSPAPPQTTSSSANHPRASVYSKDIHDSFHQPSMAAPSLLSSFLITVDPSSRRPAYSPDRMIGEDELARPIEAEERMKPMSSMEQALYVQQLQGQEQGSANALGVESVQQQQHEPREEEEEFDYRIDNAMRPHHEEDEDALEEEEQDALEAGIATTMEALLSRSSRSHHHVVMDGTVGGHRGSTESGVPLFGASSSSSRSHNAPPLQPEGSNRSFNGTFQDILQSSGRILRKIAPQ